MNIFYSLSKFLQDCWNLLEEFIENMHPQFIQDDTNDEAHKAI